MQINFFGFECLMLNIGASSYLKFIKITDPVTISDLLHYRFKS